MSLYPFPPVYRLVVDAASNTLVFHSEQVVNTGGFLCQASSLTDAELLVEAALRQEYTPHDACYILVRAYWPPDTAECAAFLEAWYYEYHKAHLTDESGGSGEPGPW